MSITISTRILRPGTSGYAAPWRVPQVAPIPRSGSRKLKFAPSSNRVRRPDSGFSQALLSDDTKDFMRPTLDTADDGVASIGDLAKRVVLGSPVTCDNSVIAMQAREPLSRRSVCGEVEICDVNILIILWYANNCSPLTRCCASPTRLSSRRREVCAHADARRLFATWPFSNVRTFFLSAVTLMERGDQRRTTCRHSSIDTHGSAVAMQIGC